MSFLSSAIHIEVCQYETFESRCDVNDIVVVERATYGRMRLGRCVKTDFGFIGCDVDVMAVLDAACSGRRSCQFSVIEPNFPNKAPCNNEFKNHLELEYTCVNGKYLRLSTPHTLVFIIIIITTTTTTTTTATTTTTTTTITIIIIRRRKRRKLLSRRSPRKPSSNAYVC